VLEDPQIDPVELRDALRASYGIVASAIRFVRGRDMQAASYEVTTDGTSYFLKVRFGPPQGAALDVPRALQDVGVPNILAPLSARSSAISAPMGARSLIMYPYIAGGNAKEAGLTGGQWRTCGSTLRAVHDSGLERRFGDTLPVDTFGATAAAAVGEMVASFGSRPAASPAVGRLVAAFRKRASRIAEVLARAEELGALLRERTFERVLCHADIHTANILVAEHGSIFLVDWDDPLIAPRERDLLFVIGGRVGRVVQPSEESQFFDGYGQVEVDRDAIVYYRYERVLEDLVELARSVLQGDLSEAACEEQVDLVERSFAKDSLLETAEQV
jgi:spectinomycin phosphotransferase